MNRFFVGLHHPSTAWPFANVMLSITTLRGRKRSMRINDWIMDSGAFTEISTYGRWRSQPESYAAEITRWSRCGNLLAAVTQDMMCEPAILARTGLSIGWHQAITVERYTRISRATSVYVMPVLQGFAPKDYVRHVEMYGDLLGYEQWVAVGSICKRNSDPGAIEDVLLAIKSVRPDLKLHGFGIKLTALEVPLICQLLESADSMAWSYAARREDGAGHDPRDALRYAAKIERLTSRTMFVQPQLLQWWS